jgi:predicted ATPase
MIAIIKDAMPRNVETLRLVLDPFLESVEARLKAQAGLQRKIEMFLHTINAFFMHKSATFRVSVGLKVRETDSSGGDIDLTSLSSGEKQLLMILSNVLLATATDAIFLIDEPELSLNVKWQRRLLDTLLKLTIDNNVQFVVATHSIEMLARHRQTVVHLTPID